MGWTRSIGLTEPALVPSTRARYGAAGHEEFSAPSSIAQKSTALRSGIFLAHESLATERSAIPPQVSQWPNAEPPSTQHFVAKVSNLVSGFPASLHLGQLAYGAMTHSIETRSGTRVSTPQLLANGLVAQGRGLLAEKGVLPSAEAAPEKMLSWSELGSPENLLAAALGVVGLRRKNKSSLLPYPRYRKKPPPAPVISIVVKSPEVASQAMQKIRSAETLLKRYERQLDQVKILEKEAYENLKRTNALFDQARPHSAEYKMLSNAMELASNQWAKRQAQVLQVSADIARKKNWLELNKLP